MTKETVKKGFLITRKKGQDDSKTSTEFFLSQSALGAIASDTFLKGSEIPREMVSLQYTKEMLEDAFKQVKEGDLSILEETLLNQAFALNIAFTNLATRANRQTDLTTMQMLMNLAFKAQNQSRATIDSLVRLKQPSSTQFIKQANIAQGHQQVNNLVEKNLTPQNELLKDGYAQLDDGTTTAPKGIDTTLEALGKVHRGKITRRKSKVIQKCHEGWQEPRGPRVNKIP
jgi:hypothetical protein